MKKLLSSFLSVCAVALVSTAVAAHADTINGTVWTGQNPYTSGVVLAAPDTSVGSHASFTVSGLDFCGGNCVAPGGTGTYTVGGFLTSNSNDLLSSGTLTTGIDNSTLNNTVFEFTGSTYLVHGQTYSITHDDGIDLFLGGSSSLEVCGTPTHVCASNSAANVHNESNLLYEVINSGSPTAADVSSFIYNGSTGEVSFDLLYTEVNGAPGELESTNFINNPPSATPEPGSLALLATALLGGAGAIRRRMTA